MQRQKIVLFYYPHHKTLILANNQLSFNEQNISFLFSAANNKL